MTIGPGLLFAAAAVGVSHLVQSTRAGAQYGLALLAFILLANAVKYPAFRFGPHYAAATGLSLLEGYRRQGAWALRIYAVLTAGTMFFVQAGVTVVTAGLAISVLGLDISPITMSGFLLAACVALLSVGRYRWLDRVTRVLVAVFTVATVLATAMVIPRIAWTSIPLWIPLGELDLRDILFLAALVGWMPSAIDVSVWQSLWTLAKKDDTGHTPSLREAMIDFHVGYLGTAGLALCFLILGAGVMYGTGVEVAQAPGAFAQQILALYSTTLGPWAGPVIGVAALAVMFSTTLTVVDGFPRAISALIARMRRPEGPETRATDLAEFKKVYWLAVSVQVLGAMILLWVALSSLPKFIDVATTLSFLTAPVLAWLNHRAVMSSDLSPDDRPRPWLRWMSLVGTMTLAAFAILYIGLIGRT